jgi:hypothetical protein
VVVEDTILAKEGAPLEITIVSAGRRREGTGSPLLVCSIVVKGLTG